MSLAVKWCKIPIQTDKLYLFIAKDNIPVAFEPESITFRLHRTCSQISDLYRLPELVNPQPTQFKLLTIIDYNTNIFHLI